LTAHITRWSALFARDLRTNDVVASVAVEVRDELQQRLGTSDSASTAITLAIAIARDHQSDTLSLIITLYARLAPILWPCISAERRARLPKSA